MGEHTDKPITIGPRKTVLGGTPWTIPQIGPAIDEMMAAYYFYLNRTNKVDGDRAIKDYKTALKQILKGAEAMYNMMAHRLPIAAPPVDRGFQSLVELSLKHWEPFSGRHLTFVQFCQHFSVRCANIVAKVGDKPMEKELALMQLFYEMHRMAKELLEIADTVDTEPDKGLQHG